MSCSELKKTEDELMRAEEICQGVYAKLTVFKHKIDYDSAPQPEQLQLLYLQSVYRRVEQQAGGRLTAAEMRRLYTMLSLVAPAGGVCDVVQELPEQQFEQMLVRLVGADSHGTVDFIKVSAVCCPLCCVLPSGARTVLSSRTVVLLCVTVMAVCWICGAASM